MRQYPTSAACVLLILAVVVSCGQDDPPKSTEQGCVVGSAEGCEGGQVCEEVQAGEAACFDPIRIEGRVFDAADGRGIEGALVVARDANGAAVSGLAETKADGTYSLVVPVPRDPEGNPDSVEYTLRSDAGGYLTFPLAPRVALPVTMDAAVDGVVMSSATDIALIALADPAGLGTISGRITIDDPKGALVVAGSATALAGTDGSFTLFNVTPGTVTVRAYRVGVNLETESVTLADEQRVDNVELGALATPASSVSGKVEIVNPGAGSLTSVILVVQDTFVQNVARGEAPPGLRAGDVSGTFTIEGVPDGEYFALAAFENDFLVRDPDTCIGGTDIVSVSVAGGNVTVEESFKVTGSLDVQSPDGEEEVTGTPTFVWADDSGEEHYELAVYDAFGHLIWEDTEVPGVSGSKTVSVSYGGEALQQGMVYQFRATSIKNGGCPISRTEDLRGVFRVP